MPGRAAKRRAWGAFITSSSQAQSRQRAARPVPAPAGSRGLARTNTEQQENRSLAAIKHGAEQHDQRQQEGRCARTEPCTRASASNNGGEHTQRREAAARDSYGCELSGKETKKMCMRMDISRLFCLGGRTNAQCTCILP